MADPHGTCYATEKIYQQNAGYSKAEVDQWMQQYAGCSHLVTLKWPKGLGTGHIDMFSKLMSDTKVLLGEYNPALQPENAEILDENAAILEAVVTESGESLSVYRIPLPWDDSGIWFTYTNSLIVNDTVLIPIYGKFKDLEAQALASYEQVSPDLSHHLINSDAIIPAGGAIHCVTMSVPNGALEKFQDDPVVLCPLNDINKCDSEGTVCGGLLQEGMCEDSLLKYCGQDGYPHAQACAECCGWDAGGLGGLGWYDCLAGTACAGCIEECVEGDSGCSAQSTQSWTCEQLDDDACLERKWAACPRVTICNSDTGECEVPEEYCVDGVCPETCGDIDEEGICEGELLLWCDDGLLLSQDCTAGGQVCGANPSLGGSLGCWAGCTDACPFDGARTCTEDGLLQVCATDRWGCLDYGVPEPCDEGLVCFDGVCGEPRPEPVIEDITTGDIQTPHNPKPKNKGCAAGSASSTTLPLLLLLLLLLGIRTGPGPCG
jgi:hypothetical protein